MSDIKKIDTPSVWETWFADWMAQNPKADDIESCNDIINTQEIMHQLFLQTGENSISIDKINESLLLHDYKFSNGGWLVV